MRAGANCADMVERGDRTSAFVVAFALIGSVLWLLFVDGGAAPGQAVMLVVVALILLGVREEWQYRRSRHRAKGERIRPPRTYEDLQPPARSRADKRS